MVRLVRIQRGKRIGSEWFGSTCISDDSGVQCQCDADLDVDRCDQGRKTDTGWCVHRTGHRSGGHHTGSRICSDLVFFPDRWTGKPDLLLYDFYN